MISDLNSLAPLVANPLRLMPVVSPATVTTGQFTRTWGGGVSPASPGAVISKFDAGTHVAFQFPDPPAGKTVRIARAQAFCNVAYGLNLMDRLWHVNVPVNVAGSQAINGAAITRYTNGRDVEIWAETSATQTTAPTLTVDYINQDGIQKTTPPLVFPTTSSQRAAQFALAAGDYGVRSIVNVNVVSAGAAADTINIVLYKDILMVPIATAGWVERDWLACGFVAIDPNAALTLLIAANSSTARRMFVAFDLVYA